MNLNKISTSLKSTGQLLFIISWGLLNTAWVIYPEVGLVAIGINVLLFIAFGVAAILSK